MAFASDSTTAPDKHPRLLRAVGRTCFLLTTAEVVALVTAGIPHSRDSRGRFLKVEQVAQPRTKLQPEPLLPAGVVLSEDTLNPGRADLDALIAATPLLPPPAPLPSLTTALSRRRAIFGGFALAAAPVAVLPALAAPTASPEAAALLREFHDVAGRFNAAGDRLDEAVMATARIPEPEALYAREMDFWTLGCIAPERHWQGRRYTYGSDKTIAQLRELAAGDGDRRRADRRDEIIGAWDCWHADQRAAKEISGEAAASDHYRTVGDEHDAFVLRLVHMKTVDPDVMKIKAALVLNAWREVERFDNAVQRVAEDSEAEIEDALSVSLMRDLIGQLGAEYRVEA